MRHNAATTLMDYVRWERETQCVTIPSLDTDNLRSMVDVLTRAIRCVPFHVVTEHLHVPAARILERLHSELAARVSGH